MTTTERHAILEAIGRQFMSPEITDMANWFEIDGTNGATWLPFDVAPSAAIDAQLDETLTDEELDAALIEALAAYYDGRIYSASIARGIGARLSASGYMDCTEWAVFPTRDEAEQYLVDMYGNDIDVELVESEA